MGYIICCGHAKTYINVLKRHVNRMPETYMCPYCQKKVELFQRRKIKSNNFRPRHFFVSERSYNLLDQLIENYGFTLPQKECTES